MITNLLLKKTKDYVKAKIPGTYEVARNIAIKIFLASRRLYLQLFFRSPGFYTVKSCGVRFDIALDPSNGLIDEEIAWKGSFEKKILETIYNHLDEGDTFIDIGMNIGEHAFLAALRVGNNGVVHGYEPIPKIIAQAEKTKEKGSFSWVHIHPYALGSKEEKMTLYLGENNIGGSSLLKKENTTAKEITVLVKNAYNELQHITPIHCIKIDTEGFEPEILKTIQPILEKEKPVLIFEYTPAQYKDYRQDLLEYIKTIGYALQEIETGENIHFPKQWEYDYKKIQSNIVCIPDYT